MNLQITQTIGWDKSKLGHVADCCLTPAIYLLKGRKVTSFDPLTFETLNLKAKWAKIALCILLFIPSIIIGSVLRLISFLQNSTKTTFTNFKTLEEKLLQDERLKCHPIENEQFVTEKSSLLMHRLSEPKEGRAPVYIVSYADGRPVYFYNQKTFIDSVKAHAADDVNFVVEGNKTCLSEAFLRAEDEILQKPRGAGYWIWKPYLILRTMNQAPENAIILYVDGGGIEMTATPSELIAAIQKTDRVFFENYHRNRPYIKRDCYIAMGCDEPYYYEARQLDASVIGFKNTAQNRQFVQEWLRYCNNPQLLTDAPSINPNLMGFEDHRHDQAILSLLYLKQKRESDLKAGLFTLSAGPSRQKAGFSHHRRRTIS